MGLNIYQYMILPPPWNRVASPGEKKKHYDAMRAALSGAKAEASQERWTARKNRDRADEAEAGKKIADKKLLHLTKKQKAVDEQKKSCYWSGAAAVCITLLYETWKVPGVGYPGGYRWRGWWEHEAVYGVLMWTATVFFGWLYKVTQNE